MMKAWTIKARYKMGNGEVVNRPLHANWFKHIGVVGADVFLFSTRRQAQTALNQIREETAKNGSTLLRRHGSWFQTRVARVKLE